MYVSGNTTMYLDNKWTDTSKLNALRKNKLVRVVVWV